MPMVEETPTVAQGNGRALAEDDYGATPVGIGGFLIVLLAFLAAAAVGFAVLLFAVARVAVESWPIWPNLVRAMVGINMVVVLLLFVLAPIVLIFLALKKLEIFPGLCIIWIWSVAVIMVAWRIATSFASAEYFPGTGIFGGLGGGFVVLSLTITSYLNRSARAENTFER